MCRPHVSGYKQSERGNERKICEKRGKDSCGKLRVGRKSEDQQEQSFVK